MRPCALALLLFLSCHFLASESKLQQQTAVDEDDEDDDDWDDEDDEDDENYPSKPEVDDDGRIYKNPRNSPSVLCPRDEDQAELLGQKCLRKCSTDEDCKSKKKKCRCDGACGMSCIKPERECPELSDIEHGVMTVTGRFFGDRAHYTCDPDFYTVGLAERTCRADGHWSGSTPSCKKDSRSFCSQPPKIKNARHNALAEQTTFDLDNTVEYFCDHGYVASGVRKAKCLLMEGVASWFGPDVVCEPQNCGSPADIANGWHAGECYTYDCRVSYHCADGFELVGRSEKLCLADGTWTPKESPQCVQVTSVQCPKPENPVNGKAVYTSVAYNSIVSYECTYGYTVVGASTRRCGADRKWTGKTPTCQEINCGSPGVLYNGWIENTDARTGLGASIIFRCNDHMKLEGNASSVCQIDGKWRYPLPQCLAPCVVPKIEYGHITVASHERDHINNVTVVEHGERLLVSCVQNYEFAASGTPVLCNNGTWSIVPSCSPARCKQMPRAPKNGMVIAPKTDHGMKAVFKCKDGFELVGGGPQNASFSVECRYGNWTGDIPHCVQLFCPYPGSIENGKVYLVGNMGVYDYRPYVKKIANNKQIMYDCDKGYVLDEGAPTGATCIGGSWSPKELPKCILGQHPRLRWSRRRRSANGTVEDNMVMNYKKFIDFFRKVGKKLLHVESTKDLDEEKHLTNSTNTNSTVSVSWKKHSGSGNKTHFRDEKMIDFLKVVYRKLQRVDTKRSNNATNISMHDLLNAMSKNFFHIDLSESKRNNSGHPHTEFEVRNQHEFIKLKREFEKIMRFYNKSLRWNEKQIRKESKKKSQLHGEKSEKGEKGKKCKDKKKKKKKNYYKGFYEFVNSYVAEKLSMLEARNATEELIKRMNIDKYTVRNGTSFTVGEMYAFFKHIIEDKLNVTDETLDAETTSAAPPAKVTAKLTNKAGEKSTTVASNEVPGLENDVPAKLLAAEQGTPKHRSKRIRNASEHPDLSKDKDKKPVALNGTLPRNGAKRSAEVRQNETSGSEGSFRKRKLMSSSNRSESKAQRVGGSSSKSSADAASKRLTFGELEAQQQSRSKRFLPLAELDNQIFLKHLYLSAYEDEYRANVKRSVPRGNDVAVVREIQ